MGHPVADLSMTLNLSKGVDDNFVNNLQKIILVHSVFLIFRSF